MTSGLAVAALGALLVACQVAPTVPLRETVTFRGDGWQVDLPADLGLEVRGSASETGAAFVSRTGEVDTHVLHVGVLRGALVPLEEYVSQLQIRDGQRIVRRETVAVPVGRAVYVEFANHGAANSSLVLAEPRPGVIVPVSSTTIVAADLLAIARSVRVHEP